MKIWEKVLEIVNEAQGTNIKMSEEFYVESWQYNPYKFTEKGLVDYDNEECGWIEDMLNKKVKIKQKRQKPKVGDRYTLIMMNSGNFTTGEKAWENHEFDNNKWNNGLGFHMDEKEKAERVIQKILEVARSEANNEK